MTIDDEYFHKNYNHRQLHYLTENATRIVYTKQVKLGDNVIDLGANHGDHTRNFSRIVGNEGVVHAFEPNPTLFNELTSIGPNVRLWPYAAGDELMHVSLHIPDGLDGWSSLIDIRKELPDRSFSICSAVQVAIDGILELEHRSITLIKIDVERREKEALLGMLKLLERCNPVVICEGNHKDNFEILESLGYACVDFFGKKASSNSSLANFIGCPRRLVLSLDQLTPTADDWEVSMRLASTL